MRLGMGPQGARALHRHEQHERRGALRHVCAPCRKLMNAYCAKASVDVDQVAFIFDGNRLRPEQTPEDVDMEEVRPYPHGCQHPSLIYSTSTP